MIVCVRLMYGGSLGPSTTTSIKLPLPSTFHFHPPSTSIKLPFPISTCALRMRKGMQARPAKMYAILFLLFLVEAVHAPALARLSRDEIIRMLLIEGFPYQLLCFLVAIFDIIIIYYYYEH